MITLLLTLAIGDSITAGVSSDPVGPGYVEILSLENLGCGGASTASWKPSAGETYCGFRESPRDYWDTLVLPALPADRATVLLGTNDATLGFPAELYEANLRELLVGLFLVGIAEVVLPTPVPRPGGTLQQQTLLAQYAEVTRELCAEYAFVVCGPDIHALLGPGDFAPGNEGHPNAFGHQKIAAALAVYVPEPSSAVLLLCGLVQVAVLGRWR